MTVQNLLCCAHTLCMSYATNTFLLVTSSVRSKQLLCFVHGQGQKRRTKTYTTYSGIPISRTPGETQIGSRNWEFEKSKMASNYAKLAGYCLVMSKSSNLNKNASFLM